MSIPGDGELPIIKRCPKVASAHDHQIRMRFSFAIALSFAGFMIASARLSSDAAPAAHRGSRLVECDRDHPPFQ
jgi:hypothetical protein